MIKHSDITGFTIKLTKGREMNQWTQKRLKRIKYQKDFETLSRGIVEVFKAIIVLWVMYLLLGFIYTLF